MQHVRGVLLLVLVCNPLSAQQIVIVGQSGSTAQLFCSGSPFQYFSDNCSTGNCSKESPIVDSCFASGGGNRYSGNVHASALSIDGAASWTYVDGNPNTSAGAYAKRLAKVYAKMRDNVTASATIYGDITVQWSNNVSGDSSAAKARIRYPCGTTDYFQSTSGSGTNLSSSPIFACQFTADDADNISVPGAGQFNFVANLEIDGQADVSSPNSAQTASFTAGANVTLVASGLRMVSMAAAWNEGYINQAAPAPFTVKVVNPEGTGQSGKTITWSATNPAGQNHTSLTQTSITSSDGYAYSELMFSSAVGEYVVKANCDDCNSNWELYFKAIANPLPNLEKATTMVSDSEVVSLSELDQTLTWGGSAYMCATISKYDERIKFRSDKEGIEVLEVASGMSGCSGGNQQILQITSKRHWCDSQAVISAYGSYTYASRLITVVIPTTESATTLITNSWDCGLIGKPPACRYSVFNIIASGSSSIDLTGVKMWERLWNRVRPPNKAPCNLIVEKQDPVVVANFGSGASGPFGYSDTVGASNILNLDHVRNCALRINQTIYLRENPPDMEPEKHACELKTPSGGVNMLTLEFDKSTNISVSRSDLP